MREHPIRRFMAAGVRCTVSTDDPMVFGNSLNEEYAALAMDTGLSRAELVASRRQRFRRGRSSGGGQGGVHGAVAGVDRVKIFR